MEKRKIVIGKEDALIVVDGQDDFIQNNGALYVAGVEGEQDNSYIIRNISQNLFFRLFGHRTFTKDDHPEDHIEHQIFGKHCISGSDGQKLHVKLLFFVHQKMIDELIKKGQHPAVISYSVATSPQFPEHIANLRKKEIKRVFVVGWAYTHCVGESAIAYACQGFETYVIRDLTRSVPLPYGDPKKMKKKLALYGVKEIFLKDIE